MVARVWEAGNRFKLGRTQIRDVSWRLTHRKEGCMILILDDPESRRTTFMTWTWSHLTQRMQTLWTSRARS